MLDTLFFIYSMMKDNLRVGLGIVVWVAVVLGFVALGIYGFQRVNSRAVVSQEVIEDVNAGMLLPRVAAEDMGLDSRILQRVDRIVEEYIAGGAMPGAVVGVVRGGAVVYERAFGYREVVDDSVAMTIDTRFDLASLTKPIATATAVMQLVERGELRLNDAVSLYIEGFEAWQDAESGEKQQIRVVDLMTHASGLPPYVSYERLVREYADSLTIGKPELIDYIAHCERRIEPRTDSCYSCLNYIALAHIVEVVSEESFEEYVQSHIFEPLGMLNTCYLPSQEYAMMCAPTTMDEYGDMLRGRVHDPLARRVMDGVSGNAGLFSTFDDIAIFASAMLNGGSWQETQILSTRAVEALLSEPIGLPGWDRTLAWEKFTNYSGVCGDLLSRSAVGHTGATGTSIVIDPELDIAIVILTNRVHSTTATTFNDLRSKIATVVASSIL